MARAASMTRNARSKRLAKQVKGGKSPISGMGAIVRKATATRNGPKASEKDHLQPKLFGGKHSAASNSVSVEKNLRGDLNSPSVGRHASVVSMGKHSNNSPAVSSSGLSYVGKHRKAA